MPGWERGGLAVWTACPLAVVLGACGAVGDPLPPLRNLPQPVSDLTARQIGHNIEFEWTWPLFTTEGTVAREVGGFTLWAVEVPDLRSDLTSETIDGYRRLVRTVDAADITDPGPGSRLRLQSPLSDWQLGQPVIVVVVGANRAGQDAGYSNQVRLQPLEPPAEPQWVKVESAPDGVSLAWEPAQQAEEYSIERTDVPDGPFRPLGRLGITSFLDRGAIRNRTYRYRLRPYRMSAAGWVEGPPSAESEITLTDRFPPAPPPGLRAVRTRSSVELSWLPSPESDVSGYYLLRDGETLSGHLTTTTFSDSAALPDANYEYTVIAIDTAGNESEPSVPVLVRRTRRPID